MDPTATSILAPLLSCLTCDGSLRDLILGHRFAQLALTIPALVLGGAFATAWATRAWARRTAEDGARGTDAGALAWSATLLGFGLGSFLDGIVLHQILQLHGFISNSLPPETLLAKSANMFWDGIFFLVTFVVTMAGVVSLWRLGRRGAIATASPWLFWGAALIGWGAIDLIDGLVSHVLLRYHDLVEASASPWPWNIGWLVFSALQVLIGGVALRRGLRRRS
ncbi:MAG TPA: DUF2243 domain-containing protein [Planctomycetota bacterium]|nr:DUF2243 domain-containing protein [Planctomycetota bacterium]